MPDALRPQYARQGPTGAQAEVKAAYWVIFDDIDQPPGQAGVNEATRREGWLAALRKAATAGSLRQQSRIPTLRDAPGQVRGMMTVLPWT